LSLQGIDKIVAQVLELTGEEPIIEAKSAIVFNYPQSFPSSVGRSVKDSCNVHRLHRFRQMQRFI
jgi:hypothetical protein